ncbi:hypothetical protein Poli38472_008960 [Pythium oligandrum]|uniref:Polycystin cation channel PKD1/PKD2 domain-containing protein n=1 Tax=Pythium oligandrum TaxID=41045 RepID=A0A8K1CM09_PYTOL|nr:hypothetical protein Poli38472_008960 [Pythium oligandrum]|eukprot:TMW64793.1 hypothetical protein Poli38472_008960 [Pythium oligandrum]
MGNSCTREADVALSERGVGGARGDRHDRARGRWSVPENYEQSVDLDTLLEAPSPPNDRRRKKSRSKAKSERQRGSSQLFSMGPPPRAGSDDSSLQRRSSSRLMNKNSRSFLGNPLPTNVENPNEDDVVYHSFEDPGYLRRSGPTLESDPFDTDLILMSPPDSPDSPNVIHARWGEPADDPDESEICTDYRPNPFKKGFCINCQKQHDVTESGEVVTQKEYKKIARPTVSKTAANAADNPLAVENLTPRNRESDVDLGALLRQRRDILLKLSKMESEKKRKEAAAAADAKRHSMFVSDSGASSLANLRVPGNQNRSYSTATPQSMRVPRTTSVVVSPRGAMSGRAEQELLRLLKTRGVPSICEAISNEIHYAWAVTSGFRTLANVGNFYFACATQTFGYNPAFDFFASGGMQMAVFALQKFVHNDTALIPVLECIHIYSKLHVDSAVDFLAVPDSKEILMKCVRFHDNKPTVISAVCQVLGNLVMNDLVKESLSTSELIVELLGLLKRYNSSLRICRSTLVPLGFLVTDAQMTATFVDGNGIALVMSAMKAFIDDTEVVWHAIGILNALHSKTMDVRLIYAIYGFTGIPRIVEALASHLDTEEIAVEGFQLLARLAALPEAYRVTNQCKVLDLAYVAVFAYSGPQHRHTRVEIKKTLHSFQKCTVYDARELATREQASRRDLILYSLFILSLLVSSVFAAYGAGSNTMTETLKRSLLEKTWVSEKLIEHRTRKTLKDVSRINDVWAFLQVEFNVFNAAEAAHVVARILFEFAATGGILVTTSFSPVYLDQFPRFFLLSPRFYTEFALFVGLIWFTKKQFDKLIRYRQYYFIVSSHLVDCLIVVLWFAVIVIRLRFVIAASHDLLVAIAANSSYVDLHVLASLANQERDLTAWCALLMWYRFLRLARCIKRLELTLEKFQRAEELIESYIVLLVIYVVGFSQTGVMLFPSALEHFRSLGTSIASTSKLLVKSWEVDEIGHADARVYRLVFQLYSLFIMLNIVVVILRERFETRKETLSATSVPDGLSILELGKRQLQSSGLQTQAPSMPQKIKVAAYRGLARLQQATKGVFAVSDGPIELTELKKVWGLRTDEEVEAANARPVESAADTLEGVLSAAETQDRLLNERLSLLSTQLQRAFHQLEMVKAFREQQEQQRKAKQKRGTRTSQPTSTM